MTLLAESPKQGSSRAAHSNKGARAEAFGFSRCLLAWLALFLFLCATVQATEPVRVLIWDEQQAEQKQGYGELFLGETLAAELSKKVGLAVRTASVTMPENGLQEGVLDSVDVIVWWGHREHGRVSPAVAERVVERVLNGKLALVALHSSHFAQPFMRLMHERAKQDAMKTVPEPERSTAKWDFGGPLKRKMVKAGEPLTPSLEKTADGYRLTPPACVFPAWRADGAPSHVKTLLPGHPIARGLPEHWDIPQTEMYAEPFHVPEPDEVVFEERWDKGEHFRSGCVWRVGKGRVFYFRPGHETYPIYRQTEIVQVLENAVRWLAKP